MRKNGDMTRYVRPPILSPVFRDADGHVIRYGDQWRDSPPENTYSVDTHPERFARLHTVAAALIAYLSTTFETQIIDDIATANDLLHPAREVVRSVRIQPNDPTCASLTIVFTAYPGIFMHAGLLHDFHYPVCGCDACDSSWEGEADELEQQVLAVAAGGYAERISTGHDPKVDYAFAYPDGGMSGQSRAHDLPAARVDAAKLILDALAEGWSAWPPAAAT